MKTKPCSLVAAICLLLSLAMLLSSCESNSYIGIANAKINDNGELVLFYEDGTEQNLGVVVGKDGENGSNRTDGFI